MTEPEYAAFIECWDDGRFFEAHEVLEGLWVRTRSRHEQALIQLAAALYHVQRGNIKGARTMIDRALSRLTDVQLPTRPVNLETMRAFAERVRATLTQTNGAELIASRPRLKPAE